MTTREPALRQPAPFWRAEDAGLDDELEETPGSLRTLLTNANLH
jgi:hypothetical protein